MPPSSWLYYKLYVGSSVGGLDYLITEMLPRVCRHNDLERWYFLRYLDEGGLHLRLRLKPSDGDANFRQIVSPIIEEALRRLPCARLPIYRPVIYRPVAGHPPRSSVIRAVETNYEPEVATFGAKGISVAERLFEVSSEVALAVLIGERAERCSRKTLVPILMQAVCNAFLSKPGASFWGRYSDYWLQVSGESADEWRPRFDGKVRDLKACGIPVLTPNAALSDDARDAVRTWHVGLSQAASAFGRLQESACLGSSALAFAFIHLMNSRLGISPIEEAYFSALLQRGSII
jgi:thiopeptide-type bacteriocin biosynthesis protein